MTGLYFRSKTYAITNDNLQGGGQVFKTLDRIIIDPEIFQGQPCIRGMRIPVTLILKLLATDKTYAQIIDDYPEIEVEDIKQCIEYAAWLASEKNVAIAGSHK